MKKINASTLVPGLVAEENYYTENGELLIAKGITILQNHLDVMMRRNIFEVYQNDCSEDEEIRHIISKEFDPLDALNLNETITENPKTLTWQEIGLNYPVLKTIKPGEAGALQLQQTKKALDLDSRLPRDIASNKPIGLPLRERAYQISIEKRTPDYKKEISLSYKEAVNRVKSVLNALANGKGVDEWTLRSIVNLFIKTYLTDRNILLNIANIKSTDIDYLYHHALNVCLLSINIAAAAKYSERQISEIGMGALLHDAGMLLIPNEIRFKKGRLSKDEWYEIQKHAILGLHLLEKVSRTPDTVLYIAYQTHERENGKGYPKQRDGRFIHPYAKIVQIADVYESLCAPRDYRPPFIPYRAMELLIKMSSRNLLSVEFVKAFLTYASLFPIGSIVELNNHQVARVIQSNERHLAKPIVSIIMDSTGELLYNNSIYQIDLSQEPSLQIIRALQPGDLPKIDIMHGF
jgi:HD-GYP domain-containing protein (c-di-GMP phosphodiesterase class II)